MSQQITITLRLKTRSKRAAADIAQGAAEHLLETFNDDGSIKEAWHRADGASSASDALRAALSDCLEYVERFCDLSDAPANSAARAACGNASRLLKR